MTVRLYDEDAYLYEFEARVVSCRETAGGFAVVLDRTAFFPEAGGQTPDRGTIMAGGAADEGTMPGQDRRVDAAGGAMDGEGPVRVLDVQIDEASGIITHMTDGPLTPGSTVTGRIDRAHRFDNMQQHTGEHIFSGLVCAAYGCSNVGFHLSDATVTMDYDRMLTAEEIAGIEARANEVIWQDLPVICTFPSEAELETLDYRSKKELTGRIRIVTIPGVDVCACCAPHVHRTGEVGLLKVLALQNYKGGIRVTIACGKRALAELSDNRRILTEMAREMSTAPEEVPAHVEKLRAELSAAKGKATSLAETLLAMRLEAEEAGDGKALSHQSENPVNIGNTGRTVGGDTLSCASEVSDDSGSTARAGGEDAPDGTTPAGGGVALLCLFESPIDPGSVRRVLDAWMDRHAGLCAIFTGSGDAGWNYLAGAGRRGDADARRIAEALKSKLGAKGGGSREMVQGRVQAPEPDIRRALENL